MGASGHWAPKLLSNGDPGPITKVRGGSREVAEKKRMKILEMWEPRQAGRRSPEEKVEAKGHQVGRREDKMYAH